MAFNHTKVKSQKVDFTKSFKDMRVFTLHVYDLAGFKKKLLQNINMTPFIKLTSEKIMDLGEANLLSVITIHYGFIPKCRLLQCFLDIPAWPPAQ